MREVYIAGDNIITSLGFTTSDNMHRLQKGVTGIRITRDQSLYPSSMPLSLVDTETLDEQFQVILDGLGKPDHPDAFTRLEKLFIASVYRALHNLSASFRNKKTLLVLSTTKGNIHLLEPGYRRQFDPQRVYPSMMGRIVQEFLGFANPPLIISNACISGIMAILTASRYLQDGLYDHAVVAGGDIISEFVISGFQSFQSLSPTPCKPYDAIRNGLSLGEGCGTLVLTTDPGLVNTLPIRITGGAVTNDANHISGPSRTGEELSIAINRALQESGLHPGDVAYINAHGTATIYNDEMESKAFHLSGLSSTPLNSLKGYWGHTLGAAGVIESVAAIRSMVNGTLIKSLGYETCGVPEPLHVITENKRAEIPAVLKTASGFGGCNATVCFQKG